MHYDRRTEGEKIQPLSLMQTESHPNRCRDFRRLSVSCLWVGGARSDVVYTVHNEMGSMPVILTHIPLGDAQTWRI